MTRTTRWRSLLAAACTALALSAGTVDAQEIPFATGQHWTKSSPEVKKAYLVGLANAFQVEAAFEAKNPPTDAQSIVPRLTRGMKGQTLDGVRDVLDAWYAQNPDRLDRPVFEVIWFEIVVPDLAKAG